MSALVRRVAAAAAIVALLHGPVARAENQMGYQLMTEQQASQLPRGGGSLGLDVTGGQVITDSAMTFELLKVQAVRRGTPASRAGLAVGDQVIAVDGRVFPSVAAFAGYVGSLPAGRTIGIDYLPRGAGPEKAQRLAVTMGGASGATPAARTPEPESHGMSMGQKLAIGAGAVALFGCYKYGCFSRGAQTQGAGVR